MKRDEAIDTMRGFAAFFVMWDHTGERDIFFSVISPIMLPLFFFVSGYLLKIEGIGIKSFIKNRLLKLLIPWIVISYVQAYFNISDIKRILKDIRVIKEIGIECTRQVVTGSAVWFVPALVISLILAYIIIKATNNTPWKYLTVSILVSIISYYCLRELYIWNIGCAMINQIFVVAGYYVKNSLSKEHKVYIQHMAWVFVYIVEIVFFIKTFHWPGFGVKYNIIQNIYMYFLLCFSGIFAIFAVTRRWSKIPLLNFMGKHSLLYFAFGPHGYIIGRKLLEFLRIDILNANIHSLIICIIASIAWIIPALIIDKVCPILNGKWSWIHVKEG